MSSKASFYGDNLRLARLMSGISLNELGEKVGTTRQYIHQLETTDKTPAPDLMKALAFELHVDEGFFSIPTGNQIKEEECHFRKLKSTLVSSRRECTAWATLLNRLIDSLEHYLELPKVNFPQCEASTLQEVEKIASECRKRWGLGDGPIKSMVRVVENAGAVVSTFDEVSEKVDALSLYRSRPIILINPNKSSPRIRMDIGHETAHIVLHNGLETGSRETEDQADYFSSHFILPRHGLLQGYTSQSKTQIDWNSIKAMKIKWGISMRAIVFRLHQADMLSPSQYRTANIHLSKTGQTKSEHFDVDIPMEKPELLPASIALLGKTYGKNLGGLLKELSIHPTFLGNLTQTNGIIDTILNEYDSPSNVINIHAYHR